MNQTPTVPRHGLARHLPLIVIVVVAVLGLVLLRDRITFQALADSRDWLIGQRDANYPLAVLGFMAAYVAIVAFSLPGSMLATLTGGYLFGVFPGVLFNVTSATIGATAIFLAARLGPGGVLAARLDASEGRVRRLRESLRENEISALFLIRLVPAVPFFVANLLPALVGVSTPRFVVTTFLGIIPGGLVYTWAGAGLGEVFERGTAPDLGLIFEPRFLLPLLALAALAALPILLRALRRGES